MECTLFTFFFLSFFLYFFLFFLIRLKCGILERNLFYVIVINVVVVTEHDVCLLIWALFEFFLPRFLPRSCKIKFLTRECSLFFLKFFPGQLQRGVWILCRNNNNRTTACMAIIRRSILFHVFWFATCRIRRDFATYITPTSVNKFINPFRLMEFVNLNPYRFKRFSRVCRSRWFQLLVSSIN